MKTAAVREHEPLSATRHTNLLRLLNPRSIAVVGASADRSKAGSQALRSPAGRKSAASTWTSRAPSNQVDAS